MVLIKLTTSLGRKMQGFGRKEVGTAAGSAVKPTRPPICSQGLRFTLAAAVILQLLVAQTSYVGHEHMYMYICICVSTYTRTHTYTNTYIDIHIYIYTYICMYVHAHTHTQMCVCIYICLFEPLGSTPNGGHPRNESARMYWCQAAQNPAPCMLLKALKPEAETPRARTETLARTVLKNRAIPDPPREHCASSSAAQNSGHQGLSH